MKDSTLSRFSPCKFKRRMFSAASALRNAGKRMRFDKTLNRNEEEMVDEIFRHILETGLLIGKRRYISYGPPVYSRFPLNAEHL